MVKFALVLVGVATFGALGLAAGLLAGAALASRPTRSGNWGKYIP